MSPWIARVVLIVRQLRIESIRRRTNVTQSFDPLGPHVDVEVNLGIDQGLQRQFRVRPDLLPPNGPPRENLVCVLDQIQGRPS